MTNSANLARKQPPVIVDLSFIPAPMAEQTAAPPLSAGAAKIVAPVKKEPVKETIAREAAAPPPPAPAAPVVASPVPVPSAKPVHQSPAGAGGPAASRVTSSTAVASKPGPQPVRTGGDGATSPEKARHHYLKEHFAYIRELIARKLVYPQQARKMGWNGKVTVSFVVCEDGSAREVKVLESSGYPMLDRCAIDTVRSVAPFPKPPVQAEIVMPVLFRLM